MPDIPRDAGTEKPKMTKALETFKHEYLTAHITLVTDCRCKHPDGTKSIYYNAKIDAIIDCADVILSEKEKLMFLAFRVRLSDDGVIY